MKLQIKIRANQKRWSDNRIKQRASVSDDVKLFKTQN